MTKSAEEPTKLSGKTTSDISSQIQDYIWDYLTSDRRDCLTVWGWKNEKQAQYAAQAVAKWVSKCRLKNAEPIECGCGVDDRGNFIQIRKAGALQ